MLYRHGRDALCGKKYDKTCKVGWKRLNRREVEENATVLEGTCKVLASCSFEQNTQWGNEVCYTLLFVHMSHNLCPNSFLESNIYVQMGLRYGCPAEDIITGLSIQCRGWKSIYLNPERESFLGIAPTSLLTMLVQHKRWAEGHFQIFLSRYCSLLYGHNRIPLKLQLAYCAGNLWAANSLPTLYYVVVPCFCLLKDIPLFPKVSSPWVLPFAYVAIAHRAYSLGEFLWCGGTFQAWCNDQRMWLFKRTTSYFFALCDTILKLLGYSNPTFVITAKVADEDVLRRYEQELMEFGDSSPMFVVLASLAMLNLFSSFGAIKKLVFNADHSEVWDRFGLQILLCFLLVALNWPVYKAVFFRKDNGGMPAPVTYKSITFAFCARTFQSARTHCGSKNNVAIDDARMKIFDIFGFQILLCYVLVFTNLPIYQGMFFRKDSGVIGSPRKVVVFNKRFDFIKTTILVHEIQKTGSGVDYVRRRISTLVTPKIGT
uniref:Uncharacterized protein n=1 Tax=Gossypium raimondii TaxID=29730 RepID=A0A0D2VHK2_GOSRA|nr:hypothetical protein B456_013G193300 [Gossypium raimondii]